MQFTPATAALIISFAASALGHSAVSLAVGDVGGSMTGIGFDKSVPLTADNKNTIEVTANVSRDFPCPPRTLTNSFEDDAQRWLGCHH